MNITNERGEPLTFGFKTFPGGERHVDVIRQEEFVKLYEGPRYIIIRAELRNSQDIVDLLLVSSALSHEFQVPIDLEIPYLPYARQDRVAARGQAFSLQVFAKMLQAADFRRIVTWDCHSNVGVSLIGLENVTLAEIILRDWTGQLAELLTDEDIVLICPDRGAVPRCQLVSDAFEQDMVLCTKNRDPATGLITDIQVGTGTLHGKKAVVIDDICDGGATFINLAEALKNKNPASLHLVVTHGIFSRGTTPLFSSGYSGIYTTRSRTQHPIKGLHVLDYSFNFTEGRT